MKRSLFLYLIVIAMTTTGCHRVSLHTVARSVAAPSGYVARKAPAFFDRDNLYKAIDGMAGEYISYGCLGLAMLEWSKPQKTEEKLHAEIYDMGNALGAFGIYSRAHVGEGEFTDVGEEAAISEDGVEFARGQFYVRLLGPENSRSVLETVAKDVVAKVPSGPQPERLVAALPAEGRLPRSQRWIPEAAFGMDFLRNVLTARYEIAGKNLELYLASFPSAAVSHEALEAFRKNVATHSPRNVEGDLPGFTYHDQWLGEVGVFQIERRLAIVVGYDKSPAVRALLQRIATSARPAR